jgi:hypothetical protein
VRDWLGIIDVPAPVLAAWFMGDTTGLDMGFRLLDDDEADQHRGGHGTAILVACRQVERSGIGLRLLRPVARRRTVLREIEHLYGHGLDVEPSRRSLDRWIDEYLAG